MIKYFVVLLMLVLISFFTIYTRHEKEKARQEERARQEQLVALKEQQREEQRVKEAQKRFEEKMAREKEMQELAEKKRLEREAAKQAAEKKAAEEKNQEEIRLAESAKIEACNKIRRKLSGARLLPWKMLKAQDRPESSSGEKTFYFVFPEDQLGGRMFLELKTVSGRPVALQRLDGNKSSEKFEPEGIRQLTKMFPYLMLNNSKAYFHAPNAEIEPCRIPSEGESFNPAKEHFGMLYDAVTQLGVKTDAFEYEVYYRPFGGKPNIPISKVRFGNSVSYYTIKSKVVNATRRNASSGTRKTSGRKIKRKYVWTDKDQIKRRIDGVIEVPRVFVARNNRHRYHTWTREYDNELKKEEDARRKWEILVRELEKEEAIERGDDNNVSDSNEFNLENGSIVYRLSEGM